MGYYSSFVVKIWVNDDQSISRGYIQHVGTQESVHFLTIDKIATFIMNHLHPPPDHLDDAKEGIDSTTFAQDR
jgi:hypothetical protein